MKRFVFPAVISALLFSGCYRDKFDEVYPGTGLFTPCDTTSHPSYSRHIAPLIQNYCIGCHSDANPRGGANLSTYAGVFPWTTYGSTSTIVGSVWHMPGYHEMPPGFLIDSCQMKLMYNWCVDGAPNN